MGGGRGEVLCNFSTTWFCDQTTWGVLWKAGCLQVVLSPKPNADCLQCIGLFHGITVTVSCEHEECKIS